MTNNDYFYSSASRQTEVTKAHFMHQVFDHLQYSHEALPGNQIAQLPFTASDLSMVLVRPMSDDKGTVTSSEVITSLTKLETTRVALALPKFKFESKYEENLKDALQAIGIIAPFFGDLCGLYGDCGPFIDKVIQKTVIDVNEKGVEAAAVTAIMVTKSGGPSEDPILMMLDHPFQFFIYDHTEDLVIFEGRLGAPEIPEGDSIVSLLSVHSEGDFWSKNFYVDPVNPF
jgi:serine protease inhibitor